jgi:hypothetical protein
VKEESHLEVGRARAQAQLFISLVKLQPESNFSPTYLVRFFKRAKTRAQV